MDRTVQLALLCLQACLLISAFTSPDTQTDALLKENPLSSDSKDNKEVIAERTVEMQKYVDKVARGCRLRPGACGPLRKNPRTKRKKRKRKRKEPRICKPYWLKSDPCERTKNEELKTDR
ncbi:uncharacterized protein LOC139912965 [Centroberyx gerrardi]